MTSLIKRLPMASLIALALGGGGAALAQTQTSGAQALDSAVIQVLGGDPAAYRQVIEGFQAAVREGDAAKAATFVDYPLTVLIDGHKRQISGTGDFVANYAGIVTPRIAAAISGEKLDDMMVNAQGVMLGNGEAWVAGVCLDTACDKTRVKVITIQPGPEAGATEAQGAAPAAPAATRSAARGVERATAGRSGETGAPDALRTFGDWVVGCDNFRGCSALGLGPEDATGAYVAIRRGGGAEDEPVVTLNVRAPEGAVAPTLRLTFGASRAPFPRTDLPVETRDGFLVAPVAADKTEALIAALSQSTRLDLRVIDGGKTGEAQRISLRGSAAALLYMDDQQKRVGTVTALLKPGQAAASTIPPVPEAPGLVPLALRPLPDPIPALPAGVVPPKDESCGPGFAPQAWALSETETLWAVCAQAGAYNTGYAMWRVGPDGAKPVDFTLPGQKPDGDPAVLSNPVLSADGLGISTFQKGRGIGDCGMMADWGWTGGGFALLRHSEMAVCRGVDPSDWPVLHLNTPL